MNLEENLAAVASAQSQNELEVLMAGVVAARGFASYCFVDGSDTHSLDPYHINTDHEWAREYRLQGFVEADPVLSRARRINLPFTWSDTILPQRRAQIKPAALITMEAAAEYGFTEGLVIPFHSVDGLGRHRSMLCSFFWQDKPQDFQRMLREIAPEMHLYVIYWMERSRDLRQAPDQMHNVVAFEASRRQVTLTDRERDVLSWAARGKTVAETAEILGISAQTVKKQVKSACERLEAGSKTHAVAKAIFRCEIDV